MIPLEGWKKVMKYRIAAASSDGIVVNQHFGKAAKFIIMESDEKRKIHVLETREIEPVCLGGNHDDDRLEKTIEKLSDCQYVLVSRIGQGAAYALEKKGIQGFEIPGMIEESVKKLLDYVEIQNMLKRD